MKIRLLLVALVTVLLMSLGAQPVKANDVPTTCYPWAHSPVRNGSVIWAEGETWCDGPFARQGQQMTLQIKKEIRLLPDRWITVAEGEWENTSLKDIYGAVARNCEDGKLSWWRSKMKHHFFKWKNGVLVEFRGSDVSPAKQRYCGVKTGWIL